jgi:hypothetical protein
MTVPAAVDRLWGAVHQLRDDVQALRLHAVEDRPGRQEEAPSKLVENIETASVTLAGWVEEALDAAAQAVAASGYPNDPARRRHALGICAEAAERIVVQLTEELVCSRRVDELTEFGRCGREERAWVAAVKEAIDRVNPSAWTVPFALAACWRELAEHTPDGGAPAVPIAPDTPSTGSERRP